MNAKWLISNIWQTTVVSKGNNRKLGAKTSKLSKWHDRKGFQNEGKGSFSPLHFPVRPSGSPLSRQVNNYFNRVRQVLVERERKKHGPGHEFKDVAWAQAATWQPQGPLKGRDGRVSNARQVATFPGANPKGASPDVVVPFSPMGPSSMFVVEVVESD